MSTKGERIAQQMGQRAGDVFRLTGVPTRCPLPGRLAAAWRRGYFTAARGPRPRRSPADRHSAPTT